MSIQDDILNRVYFYNTVLDYLIATGVIVVGMLLIRMFKHVLLQRLKRWVQQTNNRFDDFFIDNLERFGVPALYLTVIFTALSFLDYTPKVEKILRVASTLVITYLIIRFFSSLVLVLLRSVVRRQEHGEEKVKQLGGVMLIINIFIWIIGLVFLFDNLGYDVTTVIAGLGIGGIAIALAAQNILGDLFNYFVIFFDRPFEVGDFIVIDEKSGTVENIGIKTTRIKSLTGEQLVFANSDLTNSRIHNYKRMQLRRVNFKIYVVHQTPLEQLQLIPALIRNIVEAQEQVAFDRAHFSSYSESSLEFDVVYNVLNSDFNVYMDIQQNINLALFREFKSRGIEFAYPTRKVFVVNGNGQEPAAGIPGLISAS